MKKSIDAIRVLSIDMIQEANSGHPGICMGAAPIMYSLYTNHLRIDKNNDKNIIRDRFVLSAGHGSAMLYSTLHLAGLGLKMEDLKNFRQINSKTPGHPEIIDTKFIDSTSGPLGQGIAQAVGLAIAEKHNAAKFNKEGLKLVDNYTYVLCGDGDLQEGVSAEASSLAGHLGLNKLIILWDSNDIQLDNPTSVATTEDIKKRYEAYGFNVLEVLDGEDVKDIDEKIEIAKKSEKPTLIEVKTIIGYGSPNKGNKPDCHGAPLGEEEIKLVKENYGWELEKFSISEDIYKDYQTKIENNFNEREESYKKDLDKLKEIDSELYEEYIKVTQGKIKLDFELPLLELKEKVATRVASGKAINEINSKIPNLIGGSADLSKSNNSMIIDSKIFAIDGDENKNISYGVREFAMACATNGINLYGMNKAFCSTFFVFSDYLKAAIRMSAIQQIPSIYVLTHDSIAVGEDGPTHQPIEQLTGLRAIPNVNVIRPCDFNETQAAWKIAIESKTTPTVLVLSRQDLEVVTKENVFENVKKGGYIISDIEGFEKVLIGTGSEVPLLVEVQKELLTKGIKTRVVSMPSMNIFEKQSEEYKKEVLSDLCKKHKYYIEMSSALEGYKYALNVIGINEFGKSGPGNQVIENYEYTVKEITNKIVK